MGIEELAIDELGDDVVAEPLRASAVDERVDTELELEVELLGIELG